MSGGGGDKVRGCRRGEEKEEGEGRWRKEGKGQIKKGCNFQHERVYTPETNRVEKHFTLLSLLLEALTGLSVTELPATITLTIPEQNSWACA